MAKRTTSKKVAPSKLPNVFFVPKDKASCNTKLCTAPVRLGVRKFNLELSTDPLTDGILAAIRESTTPGILLPSTTLSSIGISGEGKLEAFSLKLRNHVSGLVISGREITYLLNVAGADTIQNLRVVVHNRVRKVKAQEVLAGVVYATQQAWGGSAADQLKTFAARGKNSSDIEDLDRYINAAFLPLIRFAIGGGELNGTADANQVAAKIIVRFRALGRI